MKTLKIIILSIITVFFTNLTSKAQDKEIVKSVNTIITNYMELENALAAGDGNTAKTKGNILLASISGAPRKVLSKDEIALMNKLEYDSRHISEVDLLVHQREHFASLSNNLYSLLKRLKMNKVTLYRQRCTMRKTYFLSESEKVKDPYMSMDNCSKVTETLPATK